MIDGVGTVAVASFLQLLHHQVFEDFGLVDARDKLRDFFIVCDFDLVFFGVVLSSCEVPGVGADMLVGGVATWGDEGGLCRHTFRVGNYRPRTEVSDERQYGFVTVPKVVHLFFFDVLGHDRVNN